MSLVNDLGLYAIREFDTKLAQKREEECKVSRAIEYLLELAALARDQDRDLIILKGPQAVIIESPGELVWHPDVREPVGAFRFSILQGPGPLTTWMDEERLRQWIVDLFLRTNSEKEVTVGVLGQRSLESDPDREVRYQEILRVHSAKIGKDLLPKPVES
ncbi:MAG: hypothetical protein M1150_00315 [Patescibacteria group bacterium]|nr:hypothetical protein [Patescibacteria group bacterium]